MMNCEHCQELLPELERAELPAPLHATVSAHLRQCPACAQALVALRELHTLLDSETAPSPALRAQVLARLEQEAVLGRARNSPAASPWSAWFAALWPSRPVGAFSYSLALVLCGLFSGQLLPPGTLGIGATPDLADIPAERVNLLCAVPDPPGNDIL